MTRRSPRRRLLAAPLAAVVAIASTAAIAITPVDRFQDAPDRLVMATVHWSNRAQLQQIAQRFQHLQVDEKRRTARVEASAADLAALKRLGLRAEIDDAATQRLRKGEAAMAQALSGQWPTAQSSQPQQLTAQSAIPGYVCYRTVEETYSTMSNLAAAKPTLASVIDIGPSWTWANTGGAQGYRMRVLRLNNTATDATIANKPNMVVLAAIHAREYTTAELTTRFAEWLVNGYGTDPEATWLVDNFRFHFILQANPDGRKRAESGISWRKNTDTDNGTCSANAYGVDLNRNFPWRFGTVAGGSSGDPCDATYRGPGADSEEEVQNVMRYVVGTPGAGGVYTGGVLTDRRTDTGTAPADYRGIFLDIHSFSQLVLWPWAYTSVDAPNATALQTLGRRLAYFNNYRPVQWTGLYAADGTNTDTVYGITGAPSYTIELGQEFFEDCSTFESSTYPMNLAALKYAARNLQNPYTSPAGPEAMQIAGSAVSVVRGRTFAVSAWVDDGRYNQSNGTEPVQNIASATAYLDGAPWSGVAPMTMRANDGAFNSTRELAVVEINTSGLSYGRHVVYVRGADTAGQLGTPTAIYFNVRRPLVDDDYDGDRRSDLFWRNAGTGQNTIWKGASNATQQAVWKVDAPWILAGQGDFDGDGRSDLLWRNPQSGANVAWRSGINTQSLSVASAGPPARVAAVGDFDGDGRSDLFWRNSTNGYNVIWRSASNATTTVLPAVGNGWEPVGSGDFNGDGRADVLWRNAKSGANVVWHSGTTASQQTVVAVTNLAWKIVGVGDFNGDGVADIFWRNTSTGQNTVWRSGSNATQTATASAGAAWRVVNVADYDNDGFADVAWRNTQTGANTIWKRGSNTTQQAVPAVATAWSIQPYENQP